VSDHTPARREEALSLRDYLDVLRRRRGLVYVVFALVFAGVVARALFATPVYRSHVLLQLDGERHRGGLLGELQALENASSTEAELEIMRSRRVAEGAVARLRCPDSLVEEHAYRPFEMLLRRVLPDRTPCSVSVETAPLEPDRSLERYAFSFRRADNTLALEVERRADGATESRTPPAAVTSSRCARPSMPPGGFKSG
jgi:uncharacterized protein involved in exopolysaccharide biosynthesis